MQWRKMRQTVSREALNAKQRFMLLVWMDTLLLAVAHKWPQLVRYNQLHTSTLQPIRMQEISNRFHSWVVWVKNTKGWLSRI